MSNEIIVKEEKQLEKVAEYFENQGIVDFFVKNCGYDESTVKKRAIEFITKVALQDLSKKKDIESGKVSALAGCSALSKQKVFMSLLAWNLPSDNRDLFYLYNVDGNMTVEPSYKGLKYIASGNGVNTTEGLIFDGDVLEVSETSSGDSYTIKRGDPFGRRDIKGCFVYVESDNRKPRIFLYSFEELEKSRQASVKKMWGKESPAWQMFKNDMYLKCGIRKALKIALAEVQLRTETRAIFEDEALDVQELSPQSAKTAEFESVKQSKFQELKSQFGVDIDE